VRREEFLPDKDVGLKPSWRDGIFSAAELQQQQFDPISFVVPGLLPEGLTILAGKPKVGKSWMALDIALAVAAGRYCLGDYQPEEGDVLYAALEDNPRRMKQRIAKILGSTADWPRFLQIKNTWRRLNEGGVDDIEQWLDGVTAPRLVILDTLAKVQPVRTHTGYAEDYDTLTTLHRVANERGIAVVMLHHARKMDAEDWQDTISGTHGLSGAADTNMVIARSPQGTTLSLRGRDIEDAEHAINFDKQTCRWTILGNAQDIRRSEQRAKILAAIKESSEPISPKEIAAATGQAHDNVRYLLGRMVVDGEIQKAERGRYVRA
jgi:RecA-family ATPase